MPIAFPSTGLVEVTWHLQQPTQVNKSEFTSRRRVTILGAAPRFTADVKVIPLLSEAQVRPWRAFFAALRGRSGQFRLVAVESPQISGITVTVDGANQSGFELATKGWGAAGTKLDAGMMITVNDQLVVLTAPVIADSDGKALVVFAPLVRLSPADGAAIEVSEPYALMSLADDTSSWIAGKGQQYTVQFAAEESL